MKSSDHNEHVELDASIGVEDIRYNVVCEFSCLCGNRVKESETRYTDYWGDAPDTQYAGIVRCPECGREYKIGYNDKAILL